MFFIALFYSGGMPILIGVLLLYAIVQYWTDKCLLFKVVRRPPHFDHSMNDRVFSILPWALLAHLAFSGWCYTSSDIFPDSLEASTSTQADGSSVSIVLGKSRSLWTRLTTRPGFYFAVFLVGVAAFYIIKTFFKTLCCCCLGARSSNVVNVAQGSYSN